MNTLTLEEMSRLLLKMNETLINQANEIKALKSNVDTLNKKVAALIDEKNI